MTGDDWTKPEELKALTEWATGAEWAVEIGTWTGRSAEAILRGLDAKDGVLFCVDHFGGDPEYPHVYQESYTLAGRQVIKDAWRKRLAPWIKEGRVHLIETSSAGGVKFVERLLDERMLDFVFIDGGHGYNDVRRDITTWRRLVDGILCGHDYVMPSVQQAVNDLLPGIKTGPGSLWRFDT